MELLEAILDAAAVPVIVLDLDGIVVLWNRAAEQMFGWRAEEVVGGRHPGIPRQSEAQREALLAEVRNGSRVMVETRRVTRDGRELDVLLAVTGVRVRGGDVGLTVGILHDAGELRVVQRRAEAAETRWRVLLDNVAEFAVLVLSAGGAVVDASGAAAVLLGGAREELLGLHISRFCTATPEEALAVFAAAREHGRTALEDWARRMDGSRFWADIVITATGTPEVTDYTVVLRDISQRKKEQDRERRRLEESAAVTAFAQRATQERAPEAVYEAAVEHLAGAMSADYTDLLCPAGDGLAVVLRAFDWSGSVPPGSEVSVGSTIYEDVLKRREPAVRELNEGDYAHAPHLRERGVRWGAVTTLRIDDHVCTLGAFSKSPLSETDLYPLQSIATMTEAISARRYAEHRLAASDRTLRLLYEQIPALLWTVDRDLRFTATHGAGFTAIGFKPGDGVGDPLTNYIPEDHECVIAVREALRGVASAYQGTFRGRIYDNRTQPLRDSDGNIAGAMNLALDVTELRESESALRVSREELRRLSARMSQLQEEERRRIAHELHDELGQRLTALRMQTALLPRSFGNECPVEAMQAVEAMLELIDETIVTARRVATELRPAILDHFGLRSALEHELRLWSARSGIEHELVLSPPELRVGDARTTTLYRIVQESLTNVARHSGATFVRVSLEEQEHLLVLEIADNGRGITPQELASSLSLGLIGLRERALAHGGEASVRLGPRGGTVVSVRLPRSESS